MNHLEAVNRAKEFIETARVSFEDLARIHGAVNFQAEASFAIEAMKNGKSGEYLAEVALKDPDSLKRAIVNVASVGLSLSPVHKLAYLIVRNKKVMLDISYRGLQKLAQDSGAVTWVQADIVCENDTFRLGAIGEKPTHEFSPFGDRGKIIGAYCVAKTYGGDFLTTVMNESDLESVRSRSEAWKANSGPWISDTTEMIKKTVIRRASKSWPMASTRQHLDAAIDVTDQSDPQTETKEPQKALPPARSIQLAEQQRWMIEELGRPEKNYLEYVSRICNGRKIERLEDMTETEAVSMITILGDLIDKKNAREAKKNENVG